MWYGRRINKFRRWYNREIEEESDGGVGRARENVEKKSHSSECKSTAAWRVGPTSVTEGPGLSLQNVHKTNHQSPITANHAPAIQV